MLQTALVLTAIIAPVVVTFSHSAFSILALDTLLSLPLLIFYAQGTDEPFRNQIIIKREMPEMASYYCYYYYESCCYCLCILAHLSP